MNKDMKVRKSAGYAYKKIRESIGITGSIDGLGD